MRRKATVLTVLAALITGLFLVAANSAPAAGMPNISGQWEGAYRYDDARRAGIIGNFTMNIIQKGTEIDGRVSEPRTDFGPIDEKVLTAGIAGTFDASTGTIWFVKTMDYNGHHIFYTGTFDPSGNSAAGTWRIGDYTGTWSMKKI